MRRALVLVLALAGLCLPADTAYAAVTGTLGPAALQIPNGSDFTWTCTVDPDGADVWVMGRSWLDPGGTSTVDTPRQAVSGTAAQTLTFARDGAASTTYGYRCLWYTSATSTTLVGKTANYLTVTTGTDGATQFGVLVSTNGDPGGNSAVNHQALYDDHRARFHPNGNIGLRLFASGGIPLPADVNSSGQPTVNALMLRWVATNHPGEHVTISFKAWSLARFNDLLDWAQSYGIHLELIYFHEPQDDGCKLGPGGSGAAYPSTYKAVYVQMAAARDAHPWGTHVVITKNMMDYWDRYNANRQTAWPGGYCGFRLYVEPKDAAGAKVDPADRVTWDLYPSGTYYSAAASLQLANASWAYSAAPWGFTELGSNQVYVPDTDWTHLYDWERAVTDAAADAGSVYPGMPAAENVEWWCGYGASGVIENNHLERSPDAVADYAAKVQASPLT